MVKEKAQGVVICLNSCLVLKLEEQKRFFSEIVWTTREGSGAEVLASSRQNVFLEGCLFTLEQHSRGMTDMVN